MFSARSTILLALLAACANLVIASPPACLLAAINTEQNPADLKTICGSDASKVENQITNLCGSNAGAALQAFASTCSAAGFTVPTAVTSGSTSATASGTGSITGSASSMITPGPQTIASALLYTSSYFDTGCNCTKATAISTTVMVVSTGFVSATSGLSIPSTAIPSATKAASSGTAPTARFGSCAALLIGVAGFFMAM